MSQVYGGGGPWNTDGVGTEDAVSEFLVSEDFDNFMVEEWIPGESPDC